MQIEMKGVPLKQWIPLAIHSKPEVAEWLLKNRSEGGTIIGRQLALKNGYLKVVELFDALNK